MEPYLLKVDNPRHRRALSRLRCSAHSLAIEEGRYKNIERHCRKCKFCNLNAIESEYHFLLVCPLYKELRSQLLPRYYFSWPTLTKLRLLLQNTQTGIVKRLAKFVYLAFEKRESMLL